MLANIRAILFDRDDVLVNMDWAGIMRAFVSKLPIAAQELQEKWRLFSQDFVLSDAASEQHATGAFLDELAREFAHDESAHAAIVRFDYTRFVHRFADAHVALSHARSRGLRIGVLSNNTILMSPRGLLSLVGLSDLVDVALTAQMVGAAKPDRKAYEAAGAALGVPLAQCLFFDNEAHWVQGARDAGIRAYHVDRARTAHALESGVVCDLTAVTELV